MLDFFLVLGQVPGTNYFLSFADVLWLALFSIVGPTLWSRRRKLGFELSDAKFTAFRLLLSIERAFMALGLVRRADVNRRKPSVPARAVGDLR